MAKGTLMEQEAALKEAETTSFCDLEKEKERNKTANRIKSEFVNLLKVRKILRKHL